MMSCHLATWIADKQVSRSEACKKIQPVLTTFFNCLSTSSMLKFSLDIATEISSFAGAKDVLFAGRVLPCCTGYVSPANTALA